MRRTMIITLGAAVILGGCAQLKRESSAPTCDGTHRRPANAHGSVLTPADAQPVAIGPAAAATNPSFARCNG